MKNEDKLQELSKYLKEQKAILDSLIQDSKEERGTSKEELNNYLIYSMQFAKESSRWQKIEGDRIVLELEWKHRYERASKFWKKIMIWTTPKELFKIIKHPLKK